MMVHSIPFMLERGYSAGFAAFAVGLAGIVHSTVDVLSTLTTSPTPTAISANTSAVANSAATRPAIDPKSRRPGIAGLTLLGMGNGMATLARATVIADRFGPAAYGTIASVVALASTAARAAGPFEAAGYAAAVGYGALLWTLVALSALAAVLAPRVESEAEGVGFEPTEPV